jgi:polysaccharide biosynthesis transport protein
MAIRTLRTTRDFARIWFYWKVPAILIWLVIVVGICLYSITRKPLFESEAKILLLPKTNAEKVVSAGEGQRNYDIQNVDADDINTEIQIIKSKEVLNRTKAYFEEYFPGHKNDNLIYGMNVEPIPNSNMLSVSLQSGNHDMVADVLNKFLEIYIAYQKYLYSPEENEEFYSSQKELHGRKLEEAKKKLEEFLRYNQVSNLTGQIDAHISLASELTKVLQNLEIEIAELDAKITMLKKGVKFEDGKVVLSSEMRNVPVIAELARGLVPLLIKRTEISKTFTKESREYKMIDDQILMLRDEIKKESFEVRNTNELELAGLKTRRDAVLDQIEALKLKTMDLQMKQQKVSALELDLDIAKKNYILYGTKAEDSRLYAMRNKTNISNVVISQRAVRPEKAKSPKPLLALQIALFLGFLAALLLPFLLETIDNKIKIADDMEAFFSIPVIASFRDI